MYGPSYCDAMNHGSGVKYRRESLNMVVANDIEQNSSVSNNLHFTKQTVQNTVKKPLYQANS